MNFNKKRTWARAQLWPTRLFESTPSPSMANHRALIQLFVNQSCLGQGFALFNATLTGLGLWDPAKFLFTSSETKEMVRRENEIGQLTFSPADCLSRLQLRAEFRGGRQTLESAAWRSIRLKKIVNCKRSWLTDRRCTNPIEKRLSQGKLNPSLSSSMET